MKGFFWAFAKFAAVALAFLYFKNELEPATQILMLCAVILAFVYAIYMQTYDNRKKLSELEEKLQNLRFYGCGKTCDD